MRSGILPGTSAVQTSRPVRSEGELRAAIKAIEALGATSLVSGRSSRTITIAAPFASKRGYVIPVGCAGLSILASGMIPLTALGEISTMFLVNAPLVTIRGLFVHATARANMFLDFVTMGSPDPDGVAVLENYTFCDRVFVDAAGAGSIPIVRANRQEAINQPVGATLVLGGNRGTVHGNILANTGGDAITVTGSNISIVGNDLGSGGITSTGGAGGNTVVGNTKCGVLTLHAGDQSAANA